MFTAETQRRKGDEYATRSKNEVGDCVGDTRREICRTGWRPVASLQNLLRRATVIADCVLEPGRRHVIACDGGTPKEAMRKVAERIEQSTPPCSCAELNRPKRPLFL